jgi:small subunit ribosomal protein S20
MVLGGGSVADCIEFSRRRNRRCAVLQEFAQIAVRLGKFAQPLDRPFRVADIHRPAHLFIRMANTKSALKRVRQTKVRNTRNQAAKSRIKTLRKKVAAAVESGDATTAEATFREFASAVDKSRKSNLYHDNAASRLKSKMARKISALGQAGA